MTNSGLSLGADGNIWPVDAKPAITGAFGEFRPGHFHAGMDLKLYGRIGDPCRAVDDGWVSRIKVAPNGYGRALYLKLENGKTAVYAHLDRFCDQLEGIVRNEQEIRKNFAVELFFDSEAAVRFGRGDIVAYAGRSGTRHPHLHFEIRDDRERPLNAWFQGVRIPDDIPPRPVAVAIEPLDAWSTVELDCQPRIFGNLVRRNDGAYGPRDPVGVAGRIGVSVDAYDKTGASENLLAVYSLKMFVNEELRWETRFDRISFAEARLIETERNYRLYRRGKGVFHRLFRCPGNELDICAGDGVMDAGGTDAFPLEIAIVLADAAGNESRIEFTMVPDADPDDDRLVTGEPMIQVNGWGSPARDKLNFELFDNYIRFSGPPGIRGVDIDGNLNLTLLTRPVDGREVAVWVPPITLDRPVKVTAVDRFGRAVESYTVDPILVLPSKPAEVISDDGCVRIKIPAWTVYDTTWMRIVSEPSYIVPGQVEAVYRVEPRDQPVRDRVEIELARGDIPPEDPSWGVYYLDKRSGWTFLGNERDGGFLAAPALSWEIFSLVKDVDLPRVVIKRPREGEQIKAGKMSLEASIFDTTSGVTAEGVTVTIDGDTVPAEYDSPRKRVLYEPWTKLPDGPHRLIIHAVDRVGNETIRTVNFFIQS